MAQKRMFSKDITNSEEFLDMPDSTQKLYFHLGMNADDDGFIQPKGIMRLIRAGEDDLKVLEAKGFVITFNGSVIVITHWKMNNEIKNDRKKDTIYLQHLEMLGIGLNKEYFKKKDDCIQSGSKVEPQIRLDKIRVEGLSEESPLRKEEEIEDVTYDYSGFENGEYTEPRPQKKPRSPHVATPLTPKTTNPYKVVDEFIKLYQAECEKETGVRPLCGGEDRIFILKAFKKYGANVAASISDWYIHTNIDNKLKLNIKNSMSIRTINDYQIATGIKVKTI